jgi:valyl-tRNA synthetase
MRFHPQRWAKVYDHWMGNIQDWCISRQLWWGHQIPVWQYSFDSTEQFQKAKNAYNYLLVEQCDRPDIALLVTGDLEFDSRSKVEQVKALKSEKGLSTIDAIHELFHNRGEGRGSIVVCIGPDSLPVAKKLESEFGFTQDPDVLDTWFSSWLWPFATMGWTGDKSQDSNNPTLQAFYPTTDLVTGPDIIFFWVARMIMAGYEFMDDLPFRNVYFTGIIRDKQGRKMSKSLGNSPDPLDLIAKFGADALRFGTMRSAPLGQDILFDEQNVELGRNFCNKLWNACRFRQMVGSSDFPIQGEIDPKLLTSDDKWILLKLDAAIREISDAFAEYKFSDATATLYRFFWSEYCDWYVEASKAAFFSTDEKLKANTLAVIDFVLSHTLRLFHPFLPFITEELWHGMGYAEDMPENQGGKTIMFAPWPKPLNDDFKTHYGLTKRDEKHIEARNELVTQGRNLRRAANIAANKKIKFILKPARELAAHDIEVLKLLLNAEVVEISANYQPAKNTMTVRVELGDLFLPLEGLIDIEAEKARLKKKLEKIEAEIGKVQSKLDNPNFAQKVPANVLEEHRQRVAEWQSKREHVKSALAALQS